MELELVKNFLIDTAANCVTDEKKYAIQKDEDEKKTVFCSE